MKAGRSRTNYSPVRREMSPKSRKDSIELHRTSDQKLYQPEAHFDQSQEQQHWPRDSEDIVEEVYISDCCGVSKEIDPSIKYMSTFRSLFYVFNFLVFALGLADLGMGLWFRIDPKVYEIHKYIETQNFTIAGWMMLFCGFTSCLMALVGFSAASRQVTCLLALYLVSMIILTLAFVGTLVLLTIYGLGVPLERFLTKEIYEQIRRRSMNTEVNLFMNSEAVQFMDFIQVKMRCCGAIDFRDYNKLGMIVPATCYTVDKNYISAHGCGRAIRDLFDIRAGMATGFTSAIIVTQISTIILSSLMICSIYHWRAQPKPAGFVATPRTNSMTVDEMPTTPSPRLHQQQARSRTPIIM